MVLPKIGISRFFRDFTQKLGFQAKYMDFRHWPHLQPMQATPLLTASHRILSSVARLSGAHGHLKSMKMREIPIFVKSQYLENHMGRALGPGRINRKNL